MINRVLINLESMVIKFKWVYYFKDIDFDDSNIESLVKYFNIRERETILYNKEYSKCLSQTKSRY